MQDLANITLDDGAARKGLVSTTVFAQTDRASGAVMAGQRVFLKVVRNGKPYAAAGPLKLNESRESEATRLDWARVGPRYGSSNQIKGLDHPSWDLTSISVRPLRQASVDVFGEEYLCPEFLKSIIHPIEFEDGNYRLELNYLNTGEQRVFTFTRKRGAFVTVSTVRSTAVTPQAFTLSTDHTL